MTTNPAHAKAVAEIERVVGDLWPKEKKAAPQSGFALNGDLAEVYELQWGAPGWLCAASVNQWPVFDLGETISHKGKRYVCEQNNYVSATNTMRSLLRPL